MRTQADYEYTEPSVKLIWITPEAEKIIAYCARVSNPTNQDNPNYSKLLKYCLDNHHFSVFEMASACFEIKCSRTIARQILRHRSFSFQEFSGRYSSMPETPIISKARRQDTKNRQNSIDDLDEGIKEEWVKTQLDVWTTAWNKYQDVLKQGLAKEVARNILPEGMVQSTMYMTGTIRSWIHYLDVRTGNGTQLEHIDVANEIKNILGEEIPSVFKESLNV
jgi:thymidylate synthase (FAD)